MKNRHKKSCLPVRTVFFLVILLLITSSFSISASDYLTTNGNQIVDENGRAVWLTGINWFGFETNNNVFHGIWARDLREVLDQIANLGFNLIRIPLHAQLVDTWRRGSPSAPVSITYYQMNEYLDGLNSLEVLDVTIDYCRQIGLKVMFDMHSIGPGEYMDNLWYTSSFTTADLIRVWEWLAEYYNGDDTVIAFDLKNEPHGAYSQGSNRAIWDGSSAANNWKKAAEDMGRAVLNINPRLLVLVEGIQCYPKTDEGKTWEDKGVDDYYNTWWGGSLRGAREFPISYGSNQDQLVYSPHEYGPGVYPQPWFEGNFSLTSLLTNLWRPNWFYLHEEGTSPLLIGEWGGYIDGGDNEKWMRILSDFLVQHKVHHTFWCLNPNSGDTGGILNHDWTTVTSDGKYQIVEKCLWQDHSGKYIGLDHEVVLGQSGTNITEYYGGANPPTTPPPVFTTPPPTDSPVTMGDVNGDGNITIIDALMTAQHYVGLHPNGFIAAAADVNCNGSVQIVDALMIAQYYVGLLADLDC
jgi:aryl-phospho-beta-D-glucosidase BglC (GH1 family)